MIKQVIIRPAKRSKRSLGDHEELGRPEGSWVVEINLCAPVNPEDPKTGDPSAWFTADAVLSTAQGAKQFAASFFSGEATVCDLDRV